MRTNNTVTDMAIFLSIAVCPQRKDGFYAKRKQNVQGQII